jgi:hypothetical protein
MSLGAVGRCVVSHPWPTLACARTLLHALTKYLTMPVSPQHNGAAQGGWRQRARPGLLPG